MRLMIRNTCSTLARTLDLVVFFAFSAFDSGLFRVPLWWVKSRALEAGVGIEPAYAALQAAAFVIETTA